jgi:hypothetical protein
MLNPKDRIGDCHKCPATGVKITYGWSTRNNRHCHTCDCARIRNRNALRARNYLRKSYEKGGTRKSPPRPLKRIVRKANPEAGRIMPTKAHAEDLRRDGRINREIWAERPHVCFECGKDLGKRPLKVYFSHCHGKGARPDLRHVKENIPLHCRGCHNVWEFGAREFMPRTLELFNELSVKHKDNKYNRK